MKRCFLAVFLALIALLTAACNGVPAILGIFSPAVTDVVDLGDVFGQDPPPTSTPFETEDPSAVPTAPAVLSPAPDPVDPTPGPYGPEDKLVALTFDDGPYWGVTDKILDVVEQHADDGVHVTFFVLGAQVVKYPSLVVRAARLGCEIGNHTYHHKYLTKLSPEEMLLEVEDVNEMVRELADASPVLVRPPYGAKDDAVRAGVPYPLILWNIDTLDWQTHNAEKTLEASLKCADGDIILMHDVRADSADAFEKLVPQLLEQGFKLVTVSELFAAKGIPLEAGKDYRRAK